MVVPAGIEPATLGLWVLRSNQLSYGTKWVEKENKFSFSANVGIEDAKRLRYQV